MLMSFLLKLVATAFEHWLLKIDRQGTIHNVFRAAHGCRNLCDWILELQLHALYDLNFSSLQRSAHHHVENVNAQTWECLRRISTETYMCDPLKYKLGLYFYNKTCFIQICTYRIVRFDWCGRTKQARETVDGTN